MISIFGYFYAIQTFIFFYLIHLKHLFNEILFLYFLMKFDKLVFMKFIDLFFVMKFTNYFFNDI